MYVVLNCKFKKPEMWKYDVIVFKDYTDFNFWTLYIITETCKTMANANNFTNINEKQDLKFETQSHI